jgi:hypothetical protein
MEAKSIPVMVDDRKDIGEFMMTRVAYFYVEAVEPSPDILIDHRNLGIPLMSLEFSGVLHKPTTKSLIIRADKRINGMEIWV